MQEEELISPKYSYEKTDYFFDFNFLNNGLFFCNKNISDTTKNCDETI